MTSSNFFSGLESLGLTLSRHVESKGTKNSYKKLKTAFVHKEC
jgi:hypothetical protein